MFIDRATRFAIAVISISILAGCSDEKPSPPTTMAAAPAAKPQASATRPAAAPTSAKAIRIDAGSSAAMKDKAGNEWLADTGFADGEIVDRGEVQIAGTDNPKLYQTEHFGMTSFSHAVPNGKYTVKLHFAETFDGVTGPGERVFSATVEDKTIADIDPFKEAGALNKALVKSADVEVKDGKLDIKFTESVQSPEINAIEILPQ